MKVADENLFNIKFKLFANDIRVEVMSESVVLKVHCYNMKENIKFLNFDFQA